MENIQETEAIPNPTIQPPIPSIASSPKSSFFTKRIKIFIGAMTAILIITMLTLGYLRNRNNILPSSQKEAAIIPTVSPQRKSLVIPHDKCLDIEETKVLLGSSTDIGMKEKQSEQLFDPFSYKRFYWKRDSKEPFLKYDAEAIFNNVSINPANGFGEANTKIDYSYLSDLIKNSVLPKYLQNNFMLDPLNTFEGDQQELCGGSQEEGCQKVMNKTNYFGFTNDIIAYSFVLNEGNYGYGSQDKIGTILSIGCSNILSSKNPLFDKILPFFSWELNDRVEITKTYLNDEFLWIVIDTVFGAESRGLGLFRNPEKNTWIEIPNYEPRITSCSTLEKFSVPSGVPCI